jgi:hypothetical protein
VSFQVCLLPAILQVVEKAFRVRGDQGDTQTFSQEKHEEVCTVMRKALPLQPKTTIY